MKYKQTLILLLISLAACSVSKNSIKKTNKLRQEAQDYSLSIVKAYFTEDCDKVYNSISDPVYSMEGDGAISKIGKEDRLCKSVKKAIREEAKTFQDYTEAYKIEALTPQELLEKFNRPLPDYYKTTESDFFFLGYELKEGNDRAKNFIWDDMFIFMVRKENKSWMIKGVSG